MNQERTIETRNHEIMQQQFDQAYRGLASQGFERSTDANTDACLYRGPDGRRCAVGHLLPDHLYREEINTHGLDTLTEDFEIARHLHVVGENGDLIPEIFDFLRRLQAAHDGNTAGEEMKRELAFVAEEYELTIPDIDT